MGSWKKVKIGDLFEQYRIQHIVQDNQDYGQITISKNGYIKFRTTKNGKTIGRKRQFIIDLEKYPNSLLFTRQGVAEGAIAFAPKEVDGCITTENMPMFSLKDGVSRKFVELLLKSEQYISEVKKLIPTGSAQKSIHERDLMQILLYIPDEMEQKKLSEIIDNHLNSIEILNTETETQQTLLKKLRQSILQEAIEGKLTVFWREQNPDVESASVLLEKIKAEKEQLIKEKKIKKQKPLPPINEDEMPFDIPDSWEWCRIGEVSEVKVGSTPSRPIKEYWNGDIPWVASGEVANNFIYETKEQITQAGFDSTSLIIYPKGSVLVAMIGQGKTRGQTSVLKIDATINQNVAGIVFGHSNIMSEYMWNFFLSRYETTRSGASGGNQPALNGMKIKNIVLPLPSFEEQKEIVKKIENLFKICDELETQINSSKVNSEMLMQAVLKEAFKK